MSINKKVVAIWAIGNISLALLSPPAMGQDVPDARQAELTMLRSALKSRADEIAQLKAENAKLAEQVKRLVELCAKAGIALTDAAPATAPAAKPPATPPATAPAAKPVMTLAALLRLMQDATAENKTPLQRSVAVRAIEGQDIQATLVDAGVTPDHQGGAKIFARAPAHLNTHISELKVFRLHVSEADGLKLGTRKQVSFVGTIKNVKIGAIGRGVKEEYVAGKGWNSDSTWNVQWSIIVDPARILP